ncbi:YoaK family protein [Nocardioides zeae]|uniref:YoaK family protein n=1 Tax=Nocardioides imazamoxiresistens TaxID=3231893 RepID=A0ABU3Q0F7_9ACTN|nr:YoaK family protein [Nocardioides zeae]MDT9594992.1 YoaK family protein [Nocardioides zeae]
MNAAAVPPAPAAPAARADGPRATTRTSVALLLALTFSTGVADAVGYLGLDKVFTGNMTGNVVILGMGAAGADDLPVLGPVCALVAFMAGAVLGGRLVRGRPDGWGRRVSLLMLPVAAVLAACAVAAALVPDVGEEGAATVAVAASVAVAMGLQAAVARHVAVKDLTTVVVTSTITGLAADSPLGAAADQPWVRRALAIVLIAAGAAVGALLLQAGLAWGLGASAVLTTVVALVGLRASRG